MTTTLAPGLLTGSAPPANAPPGPTTGISSKSTGSTKTGDTPPASFAALLQTATRQGAEAQGGGETNRTDVRSAPDEPTVEELLARLLALAQGLTGEGGPGKTDEHTTLLLDRLAEAGGPDDRVDGADALDALEALMAYLVMGQPTQAGPDATTALPDDLAALFQQIEAAIEAATDASMDVLAGVGGLNEPGGSAGVIARLDEILERLEATPDDAGVIAEVQEFLRDLVTAEEAGTQAATLDGAAGEGDLTPVTSPATKTAEAAGTAGHIEASPTAAVAGASASGERSSDGGTQQRTAESVPAEVTGVDADTSTSSTRNAEATASMATVTSTQPAPSGTARVEVTVPRPVDVATLPAEVANVVQTATLNGDSEVRLVLNPPELGHLDIHIARGEHGLRITVEAAQSGARELLDRSMAGLHHALESRDLRVDRLEVRGTDTGRGSLDTSAGGQQSHGGSRGSEGDGTPEWSPVARLGPVTETAVETAQPEQQTAARAGRDALAGSVDVLA